jgi:hypothetical protein
VGKGVAVTINTTDNWANIGIKWEVRDSDVLETSVAYLLIRTGALVHHHEDASKEQGRDCKRYINYTQGSQYLPICKVLYI